MKTKEFIDFVEENGGFNMSDIRSMYNQDKPKVGFKKWFVGMLMKRYTLSRYVANKVADYYA
jgi:hypothetical protein